MSVALYPTGLKAWSTGVKTQAWTSPENNTAGTSPKDFGWLPARGKAENLTRVALKRIQATRFTSLF